MGMVNWETGETYESKFRPVTLEGKTAWINPEATKQHKLTQADLAQAPDFEEGFKEFLKAAQGKQILAFNSRFDLGALRSEIDNQIAVSRTPEYWKKIKDEESKAGGVLSPERWVDVGGVMRSFVHGAEVETDEGKKKTVSATTGTLAEVLKLFKQNLGIDVGEVVSHDALSDVLAPSKGLQHLIGEGKLPPQFGDVLVQAYWDILKDQGIPLPVPGATGHFGRRGMQIGYTPGAADPGVFLSPTDGSQSSVSSATAFESPGPATPEAQTPDSSEKEEPPRPVKRDPLLNVWKQFAGPEMADDARLPAMTTLLKHLRARHQLLEQITGTQAEAVYGPTIRAEMKDIVGKASRLKDAGVEAGNNAEALVKHYEYLYGSLHPGPFKKRGLSKRVAEFMGEDPEHDKKHLSPEQLGDIRDMATREKQVRRRGVPERDRVDRQPFEELTGAYRDQFGAEGQNRSRLARNDKLEKSLHGGILGAVFGGMGLAGLGLATGGVGLGLPGILAAVSGTSILGTFAPSLFDAGKGLSGYQNAPTETGTEAEPPPSTTESEESQERRRGFRFRARLRLLRNNWRKRFSGSGDGPPDAATGEGGQDPERQTPFAAKLGGFVEKLGTTVLAMNAALSNLLSSASPDAFKTLRLSFTLVAVEIGQALIPAAVALIKGLQNLASWLRGIEPETKRFYGWIAAIGAAIGTTLLAGAKLVSLFSSVGAAFATLGGLLTGLVGRVAGVTAATAAAGGAGMSGGRVGTVFGGVVGGVLGQQLGASFGFGTGGQLGLAVLGSVVGSVAASFGVLGATMTGVIAAASGLAIALSNTTKAQAESLEKGILGANTQAMNPETRAKDEKLKNILAQAAQIQDPQERDRFLQKHEADARTEETQHAQNANWYAERVQGWWGAKRAQVRGAFGYNNHAEMLKKEQDEANVAGARRNVLQEEREKLYRSQQGLPALAARGGKQGTPEDAAKTERLKNYLASVAMKVQPTYSSIDDVYRKITTSALGQDPLEQEVMKRQMQMNQELLKELLSSEPIQALIDIKRSTNNMGAR
jgi:DNA polymerase III epsilon subunit-like protein